MGRNYDDIQARLDEIRQRKKGARKRTTKEIDIDYRDTVNLLDEGFTWREVAITLNNLRDYYVSVSMLMSAYNTRLSNANLAITKEDQLKIAIADLDAIMDKALEGYNASIGENVTVKHQDIIGDKFSGSTVTTITKQLNGNPKFLDTYLKAFEKKMQLLELDKTNDFNFEVFLNTHEIDDDFGGEQMKPITSEDAMRNGG